MRPSTMSARLQTLNLRISALDKQTSRNRNAPRSSKFSARAEAVSEEASIPSAPPAWCAGLPGSTPPFKKFDPLGLTDGKSDGVLKRYREAEVTHGRVSMLAVLGCAVGENFNPLFDGKITGPAINQFQQVPGPFWTFLVFLIGLAEAYRATYGWVNPVGVDTVPGSETMFTLKPDYNPGDVGFDPLGLKPTNKADLEVMQNKELNNGRLAMIAIAGIVVQELVTGEKVF